MDRRRRNWKRRYPKVRFLGEKTGRDLSSHLAAADVFVFPSLTDTSASFNLEALACGTPVAAFPVTVAGRDRGSPRWRSGYDLRQRLHPRAWHVA